uniref:Uncharacterized protein n=1 Tax=Octopus bimaculoides TaxID=37653 RepID=A0A0L8IFJ7_OCTBM
MSRFALCKTVLEMSPPNQSFGVKLVKKFQNIIFKVELKNLGKRNSINCCP